MGSVAHKAPIVRPPNPGVMTRGVSLCPWGSGYVLTSENVIEELEPDITEYSPDGERYQSAVVACIYIAAAGAFALFSWLLFSWLTK